MNLENYFISQFKSKKIGDDGALIDGFVYSKDAFFENVHFKRNWMSYYQIARKAMLVNISDAIAMNAQPKYILLSVAMPKNISKIQMKELAQGFLDVAKEYNIDIIGGDTISNTKLDITITVISKTENPLLRKGVRKNHLVAYTGTLGHSAKDLKRLFNKGSLHKKSKFLNIKLQQNFISNTARFLSAGMDISDGLWSDLEKIASVNRVGFKCMRYISKSVACSGEEYEMLVTFDKRELKTVKRRAFQSRVKLNIFAEVVRKKYLNRCKAHHF